MAVGMNITLTDFTIFVCTIEYRQVFLSEKWRAFNGHRSADIIVGTCDGIFTEAEGFEQAPFEIIILFSRESQTLQAFFSQIINIKYKSDFKSRGNSVVKLFDFFGKKSFFTQCLVIDER